MSRKRGKPPRAPTAETPPREPEPAAQAPQAEAPADEESPYDRLLRRGAEALTDTELLAVLFRNGASAEAALERARKLDAWLGGLTGLRQARLATLRGVGLTERRAAPVLAAVEIARRLTRAELPPRRPLSEPATLVRYLTAHYSSTDQEILGAVFLDTRHRIIGDMAFFRGKLHHAAVEPRPILKMAFLLDAAEVVIFHGRPTDDPDPSHEDLLFTRRMARAGELMGVRLADHLIITPSARWTSLRAQWMALARRRSGGR